MSMRAMAAVLMNSGSLMIASKAARSALTRSGGTLGAVASGLPTAPPETIKSMTCRSSSLRASSCTDGTSNSFDFGSAWTRMLILLSLIQAGLSDFQLSQELVTPSTSRRSIATTMVLLP